MGVHPEPGSPFTARFARDEFDFATIRVQRLPEKMRLSCFEPGMLC
jgi:hypothetical protein